MLNKRASVSIGRNDWVCQSETSPRCTATAFQEPRGAEGPISALRRGFSFIFLFKEVDMLLMKKGQAEGTRG